MQSLFPAVLLSRRIYVANYLLSMLVQIDKKQFHATRIQIMEQASWLCLSTRKNCEPVQNLLVGFLKKTLSRFFPELRIKNYILKKKSEGNELIILI